MNARRIRRRQRRCESFNVRRQLAFNDPPAGRQLTPRGPLRQLLCTMGMSSASGKLLTSRTVAPSPSTTQM